MAPKTLNYLAFQSFDVERTSWMYSQKHVVRTKLDIYVFIVDIVLEHNIGFPICKSVGMGILNINTIFC
jgi:hypothetical protein